MSEANVRNTHLPSSQHGASRTAIWALPDAQLSANVSLWIDRITSDSLTSYRCSYMALGSLQNSNKPSMNL